MPKTQPVTLGPYPEDEADHMVEVYQAKGDQAVKKPRPGREGQFMVEINMKT